MFDFEVHLPNPIACSVNDESMAVLSFHNVVYTIGFGHAGYGSLITVDSKVVHSDVSGVIRGEKFFNRYSVTPGVK